MVVRAYFREAFRVPMLRVSADQVKWVAGGGDLPSLNATVVPRMVQTRDEWDRPAGAHPGVGGCWLDSIMVTDEAVLIAATDPGTIPELAGAWGGMDDEAREFVRRVIGNSRSLHETVNALAALAERLQQNSLAANPRVATGA